MRVVVASVCLWLACLASAVAQLDVRSSVETALVGGYPRVVGDYVLIAGEPETRRVGVLIVETEAAVVDVQAETQEREPVAVTAASQSVYVIDRVGRVWVTITAIDFDRRIYARRVVVMEIGARPTPDPDPPAPPDPPPPPPDDDVRDVYHVGRVAFERAPADSATAGYLSDSYRAASGTLYGHGGIRTINQVLAQLADDFARKTCPSVEVCQAWAVWRQAVTDAINAEQSRRETGFTREQWAELLVEIADALERVR